MNVYYCETEGCVNDVKRVFCEDVELLCNKEISNCSYGPLPPNTICQHRGRLFVSTFLNSCEFEGDTGYIDTKTCTDCSFLNRATTPAVTPSTVETSSQPNSKLLGVVPAVVCVVVLLVFGVLYRIVKQQQRRTQTSPGLQNDSSLV
ncbi:sorting nexin-14 [Sarotherodon galilaeus]